MLESSIPGCAAEGCTHLMDTLISSFSLNLLLFSEMFHCHLQKLAHNKPLHFLFAAAHALFQPAEFLP